MKENYEVKNLANEIDNKIKNIDEKINKISFLTSKINEEGVPSELIAEYISIFNQLLTDGLEPNPIQTSINNLTNKHTTEANSEACRINYEYIRQIATLKKLVDLLPNEFAARNKLNNRLLDNCSYEWIERFNEGKFINSQEDYTAFRNSQQGVDWSNTVEIKTWGTKDELSNGLKNVLRQKAQGEGIGHAALMIRIPVNETNRKLVDKYCLHENGSLKIPHQIQKYGDQNVYEIYWSYWPGRLNKIKDDILDERSGFEFSTKSGILNQLPQELKEKYVLQKQKKNILGNTQVVDLAPIAIPVIRAKTYDHQRENFIELKIKKYKLDEEIESLRMLRKTILRREESFIQIQLTLGQRKILNHLLIFLLF